MLQGVPAEGGLYFPWAVNPNGGMVVSNVTFVNFKNACLRGCAHCGRAGSPVFGDGGWETRFEKLKFVNSPQRALFRHPNEGACMYVCMCLCVCVCCECVKLVFLNAPHMALFRHRTEPVCLCVRVCVCVFNVIFLCLRGFVYCVHNGVQTIKPRTAFLLMHQRKDIHTVNLYIHTSKQVSNCIFIHMNNTHTYTHTHIQTCTRSILLRSRRHVNRSTLS
jgi:hypothetical protein